MCGICGAIWRTSRGGVSQETLDAATDALVHRGPDDRGTCRRPLTPGAPLEEKGFAFGHRRLAIVDLSRAGRQPFANADKTVWLTFNGEIYNYVELRRELEKRGRVFRTQTDVEVLLQAYEEYGIDALRRFNGMFAFAIWDSRKRRFLLARDRVGKKPLVYRYDGDRLLFASELKALKRFPGVPFELDLVALRQYLTYQYVPHPRTIYKGIAKLPPASFLLWNERDEPRVQKYWKLENVANFNTNSGVTTQDIERLRAEGSIDAGAFDGAASLNLTTATYEEATRELRRRLENAVRVRMRCDVPFGAFLSAGVDSTIVTGLMRQFSEKKVRTFSIGFAQKEYDETSYARQTAKLFGTDHTEFFVEPCANDFLTKIVAQYDEPFADSSAIPTLCLCETTRREVTVALGGDGGDELFAGYDRYKAFRIAQAMRYAPRSVRNFVAGPLRSLIPRGTRQRSP
ncbi:MAG: asparagine synthase (glutamine-hydrolyzing), partial [Planctomycetia bacterium]|nr:asparagine synthase (glutamine-hydrolyzing) [Planctomycetia bacterium]